MKTATTSRCLVLPIRAILIVKQKAERPKTVSAHIKATPDALSSRRRLGFTHHVNTICTWLQRLLLQHSITYRNRVETQIRQFSISAPVGLLSLLLARSCSQRLVTVVFWPSLGAQCQTPSKTHTDKRTNGKKTNGQSDNRTKRQTDRRQESSLVHFSLKCDIWWQYFNDFPDIN